MDHARQSVQVAHERVRGAILSGEMPAGAELSQVRLAEELGISRIPLREALRMLQREGLVESEVNQRARVAPLSIGELEQLYAMRVQLEALGVRLAVPRLGGEGLAGLEDALSGMDEQAKGHDYEGWEASHRDFHARLVSGSGERIEREISRLYDHAERYRRAFMLRTSGSWETSAAEHREILEVCKAGDGVAAAARLARHYSAAALGLLAVLAPEHDPVVVRAALHAAIGSDADGRIRI